jgi:SAM-dependent methyltransferase
MCTVLPSDYTIEASRAPLVRLQEAKAGGDLLVEQHSRLPPALVKVYNRRMIDPTQRFSSRVENYIKYRPSYPLQMVATLRDECQLSPETLVADIGSGTGLLSELFLRNGNRVLAIEPNPEMRLAAERTWRDHPNFVSLAGRAEATGLGDQSVDFIVAGQAFHWFDQDQARLEFTRLLKPAGWVMLIWNERQTSGTPFLVAYEELLQRYATDYTQVDHRYVVDEAALSRFFGSGGFRHKAFPYRQDFDYPGLRGRLLSSSYTPEAGHPDHQPMLAALSQIFQDHQIDGRVAFEYTTNMYYGRLS